MPAADDQPPKINKWDGQTVKNTLDDEIRRILNNRVGWSENHSQMNGRLLISTIAVLFSLFAIAYDYIHPFPKSRIVLAICSISYFILMGILQLYQWFVEANTFYRATEALSNSKTRQWKWNSDLHAYDDKYTLSASFVGSAGSGRAEISKSVGNYINDEGEIVRDRLTADVLGLYKKLE